MNTNKTQKKNPSSSLEQILEVVLHKIAAVRPPTSYLISSSSKMKSSGVYFVQTQIEKQRQI